MPMMNSVMHRIFSGECLLPPAALPPPPFPPSCVGSKKMMRTCRNAMVVTSSNTMDSHFLDEYSRPNTSHDSKAVVGKFTCAIILRLPGSKVCSALKAHICAALNAPAIGRTRKAPRISRQRRKPLGPSRMDAIAMPTAMDSAFLAQITNGAHIRPCVAAQEMARLFEASRATKRKTNHAACLSSAFFRRWRWPRAVRHSKAKSAGEELCRMTAAGVGSSSQTRCNATETGSTSQGAAVESSRPGTLWSVQLSLRCNPSCHSKPPVSTPCMETHLRRVPLSPSKSIWSTILLSQ